MASAGPAPRYSFNEPVITTLPHVLRVYWGFHSWWCSCACVCASYPELDLGCTSVSQNAERVAGFAAGNATKSGAWD